MANVDWFVEERFGLFVHYGLYSILERDDMLVLAK